MSHYFINDPNLKHSRKQIVFRFLGVDYRFVSDKGVFSKDHVDTGTMLMLTQLSKRNLSGNFLDLGCGYGVVGIVIKSLFGHLTVVASDINKRAIELTKENVGYHQLDVDVVESDGFAALDVTFDTIAINPPIKIGKVKMYDLFAQAAEHLKKGGSFYLVIRKDQGAPSALKYLKTIFDEVAIIHRKKGFWIISCEKT